MPAEKRYVIRVLSYWYTDEHYTHLYDAACHFGHMQSIFEDKAEAIAQWKQLEYDFCHHAAIQFNHLIHSPYSAADPHAANREFLKSLPADALFEQLQQLDQCMYALYEYPKHQSFCALQHLPIADAQMEEDFRQNKFLEYYFTAESNSADGLNPPVSHDRYIENASHVLHGDLADLSEAPGLLHNFIEQQPQLHYDAGKKQLHLLLQPGLITALNALLKHPVELAQLSLMDVFQLEQRANQEQ